MAAPETHVELFRVRRSIWTFSKND